MQERPILFNSEMVRAIIAGSKTQTRRVAKLNDSGRVQLAGRNWHPEDPYALEACPYGQEEDLLWVRESFCYADLLVDGVNRDDPIYVGYRVDKECRVYNGDGIKHSMSDPLSQYAWNWEHNCVRWRPSIHMPRWASRINFKITDIRLERVQNITGDDAKAEGVEVKRPSMFGVYYPEQYRLAFRDLWDSINGKPRADGVDISWAANPWVWVTVFKKIKEKSHE